jgi:putative membrane-bound dehydrogenase-like protein
MQSRRPPLLLTRFRIGVRSLKVVVAMVAVLFAAVVRAEVNSPLSPAESLAHFQVEAGLAIELVACEPAVIDPIAIRFDEDGRLWVVEMRDYPHGPPAGEKPLSTIRVLTDEDGDGRYERSRVFADRLLFPTGLQLWRQGVIVTLAGQVVYLKDNDGDGRADQEQEWFRGFVAENPQLRANHPRFGLDNRVTIANGLRGGSIVDPRRPEQKPLSISGMDFCFDPRTGDCEAVSGNGQFGLAFDDFGNRFVCNNRAPLEHVVLENRYLARNPFLAVQGVLAHVAAEGEQSHVFPLTSAWTTSNLHSGQFTAACGVEIYRGNALGAEYLGNAFVCEPTGSLVHREVLAAEGVSFTSKPPHAGKEFLATPDAWFRPVNLEIGPDGALYVVDMYRAVIEHPQFMPSELQKRPDLRLGDDRGRIYRIVPAAARPKRIKPHLSAAPTKELVELLRHKNAWWRETAARLLFERQDRAARVALEAVAKNETQPVARVHALWTLAGLDILSPEVIEAALADAHPKVREQAVALAERQLHANPALRQKLIALATDRDARVRFRVALALGGLPSGDVVAPLVAIALEQTEEMWTRQAVASATPQHAAPVLLATLESPRLHGKITAGQRSLVRELAMVVGSRRELSEIAAVLTKVCDPSGTPSDAANESALLGLALGIERRGGTLADLAERLPEDLTAVKIRSQAVFDRAADEALDERLDEDVRAQKIDLLKHARSERARTVLVRIVSKDPSQILRTRAAGALAAAPGDEVGPALVECFPSQTPAVRRAILDALLAQPSRAQLLLAAIESNQIARTELDAARETRLLKHADPAVRGRAAKLLTKVLPAERKLVLEQYRSALALRSDPRAGKELFRKHCSTCHHIGDVGVDVAPDISDSRVKTCEQLLVDILNPNQAIDNNYMSYTVVTHDGNVHTGIIAAETASSITLRQPEDKRIDVLRTDIDTLKSNGVSLMPEGLEKSLSQQELADVISFVKNWRYLDQSIPGAAGQ